jgi:hypothetical protein
MPHNTAVFLAFGDRGRDGEGEREGKRGSLTTPGNPIVFVFFQIL